jgi:hypothetical protein
MDVCMNIHMDISMDICMESTSICDEMRGHRPLWGPMSKKLFLLLFLRKEKIYLSNLI